MEDFTHWSEMLDFEVCGIPVVLRQNPNTFLHGTTVWDSSKVLAKYFEKNQRSYSKRKLRGKRALELGAGCGLLGMSFALMGCDVILTDQPDVVPHLKENVASNLSNINATASMLEGYGRMEVQEYSWGSEDVEHLNPPFDFIIGSDLVYDETAVRLLLKSLDILATQRTIVLLANERRCSDVDALFRTAAAAKFDLKQIPSAKLDKIYSKDSISVFQLKRKRVDNKAQQAASS